MAVLIFVGVRIVRARLLGFYLRPTDCWKLPYLSKQSSFWKFAFRSTPDPDAFAQDLLHNRLRKQNECESSMGAGAMGGSGAPKIVDPQRSANTPKGPPPVPPAQARVSPAIWVPGLLILLSS